MKVGFIGLGIMGKPMCANLLKKGYDVVVNTLNVETIKEMEALGAKGAATAKEVGEQVDVLITMVPNSPQVDEVLFGENGAAEGLKKGATVIDMSSINPVESQRFAKQLAEQGVDFMDAPVSGGEPGAIAGTISVMVGGKQETFDKFYDLLKAMAGSVVRVGDVGAGNVTKLSNQIIVAVNIAAVSEAFVLAKNANVDPALVFEAIKGGLAGSNVMNAKAPMMLDRNFNPGFRIDLHIKDLQNALDAAHSLHTAVPFCAQVMEMMQAVKNDGFGDRDHSKLLHYFEKMNNTTLDK